MLKGFVAGLAVVQARASAGLASSSAHCTVVVVGSKSRVVIETFRALARTQEIRYIEIVPKLAFSAMRG